MRRSMIETLPADIVVYGYVDITATPMARHNYTDMQYKQMFPGIRGHIHTTLQ